jgi:hypothetical protein
MANNFFKTKTNFLGTAQKCASLIPFADNFKKKAVSTLIYKWSGTFLKAKRLNQVETVQNITNAF